MRRARWLVWIGAIACTPKAAPIDDRPAPSAGAALASASAAAPAPSASAHHAAGAAKASVVAFVENDYARALATARASGLPLFVDTWAPWCHSCLSMREYVFTDARLAPLAQRFVWLAVDSENADNGDFLARFPSTTLPTLWVIDAATEKPALKWVGAATAAELVALLEDAAASVKQGGGGEAAAAFFRGNQATGEGKPEDAVAEYKKALGAAPARWPRRAAAVEALSMRLEELDRHAECIALALTEVPRLPPGTPKSNVLVNALMAAEALPPNAPARAKIAPLLAEARRILADPAYPFLADDRSGLYETVVATLHGTDAAAAKRLARDWATFLEGEAARATTPAARAVWDAHRLGAYIELGEVEKALPMLAASERDFPDDYNPPARLARAFFELKRLDDAQAAVTRALAKAYGPRELQIFMLEADIQLARGDRAAARGAIEEAIAAANAMRLPPKYSRIREQLDRRLAALAAK